MALAICWGWFVGDVCFSVPSFFGAKFFKTAAGAAVRATNMEPTETYFTPAWFSECPMVWVELQWSNQKGPRKCFL